MGGDNKAVEIKNAAGTPNKAKGKQREVDIVKTVNRA